MIRINVCMYVVHIWAYLSCNSSAKEKEKKEEEIFINLLHSQTKIMK